MRDNSCQRFRRQDSSFVLTAANRRKTHLISLKSSVLPAAAPIKDGPHKHPNRRANSCYLRWHDNRSDLSLALMSRLFTPALVQTHTSANSPDRVGTRRLSSPLALQRGRFTAASLFIFPVPVQLGRFFPVQHRRWSGSGGNRTDGSALPGESRLLSHSFHLSSLEPCN